MKSLLNALTAIALTTVMILPLNGCCEEEPEVIVPNPAAASPVVKGTVTTNGGEPLAGAVITVTGADTFTATSDAEGKYSIEVPEGLYSITASKEGYLEPEGSSFTASKDGVTLWNTILTGSIETSGDINAGVDTHITVLIPPVVDAASTGTDKLTAFVPYGSTEQNDRLLMEFSYDASILESEGESFLMRLINVNCSLSSGQELRHPVTITISAPEKPSRMKLNGEDIDFTFDSQNGVISVETQTLGLLTADYYVNIREYECGTEENSFEQNEYDNLYGSAPMHITNPRYTYNSGATIEGGNVFLNSIAAVYAGYTDREKETAEYQLDMELPVGAGLTLTSTQYFTATEITIANPATRASAAKGSTVTSSANTKVKTKTKTKKHSGGGSR